MLPQMVTGDEAALYNAVRLDTYKPINDGPLMSANVATGFVAWRTAGGDNRTATLGENLIRIVPKGRA